jgi:hypothetical protein
MLEIGCIKQRVYYLMIITHLAKQLVYAALYAPWNVGLLATDRRCIVNRSTQSASPIFRGKAAIAATRYLKTQ